MPYFNCCAPCISVRGVLVYLLYFVLHVICKHFNFDLFSLGSDRIAAMSDRANMPYTCAFIEELYRFRTMAPQSLPHKTTEDVKLNGYFIPKNTLVIIIRFCEEVFRKGLCFTYNRHIGSKH